MYRIFLYLMVIIWLIEIWFLGECIFVDIWRPCNEDWILTIATSLGSCKGSEKMGWQYLEEQVKWRESQPIGNGDRHETSNGKYCGFLEGELQEILLEN